MGKWVDKTFKKAYNKEKDENTVISAVGNHGRLIINARSPRKGEFYGR